MNRIDRLMGLISLLQRKKPHSAADIAEHFGISERTAFRDLRALGEIGVPVAFEPDRGYSIAEGYFLPPVTLSVDEAHALSLAEPLIVRFADRSIQRHYASALGKINLALGRAQREKFQRAREQSAHFIPDHYEHLMPHGDYLARLQHAVAERITIAMDYENAAGETSGRLVEPIGLIFYSLNWHLVGWCRLRQAYRDFRVNRMSNLRITLQPFLKTDHISLEDYILNLREEISKDSDHPLT